MGHKRMKTVISRPGCMYITGMAIKPISYCKHPITEPFVPACACKMMSCEALTACRQDMRAAC